MRLRVLGVVALSMLLATPMTGTAQGLGKSGDGLFKVVKPPARGARQRLTIHPVRRGLPPGTERQAAKKSARHAWFWRVASPRLDAANVARADGLAATAARTIGGANAKALVRRIGKTYRAEIVAAAGAANVSPALLIAVVAAESAGKPTAKSPKGAQGLAQLMPATAARFGVKNAYDPGQNLKGAATYLSLLLDMFGEDTLLALAGYNAGENAVKRNKGVPPYRETRDYVPIVLSYFHEAKTLCGGLRPGPRGDCAL